MADVIRRDQTIDRLVSKTLQAENEVRNATHVSSGKLSASMLFWPVQWQVLKTIGYPPKEVDEYVLRKFRRGNHVEDWLISQMPGVIERQKQVEYKGAIGFVDALVDSTSYEFSYGIIPHEVKSVSNAKYKNIIREMKPDTAHALQAAFYAMALGTEQFVIDYVATDDYRIESFVLDTEKYRVQVEESITAYNKAMEIWNATKFIPEFVPNEDWQANPQYSQYPDCVHISDEKKEEILFVISHKDKVDRVDGLSGEEEQLVVREVNKGGDNTNV